LIIDLAGELEFRKITLKWRVLRFYDGKLSLNVTRAFSWAILNPESSGIYNLIAPQNITNAQFTKELSKMLHRPAFFAVPAFALKIGYGEAASLLLQSPVVYPERLINSGFKFNYPDIQSCLAGIIS